MTNELTRPAGLVAIATAWCAVANIAAVHAFGPHGAGIQEGTKHFDPGAKVHVLHLFWGICGDRATVVGRHRGSKRHVTMVINSAWLANWRVALVYQPVIVRLLAAEGEYDRASPGSEAARRRAEEIVEIWRQRGAPVQDARSTRSQRGSA